MTFRHGNSLLFVWLVETCPVQLPAGACLHLALFKPGLSAELGSSPNLQRGKALVLRLNDKSHYKTIQSMKRLQNVLIQGCIKYLWCKAHLLPADRTVNKRLLLLLEFSSASFFPKVAWALFFSSLGLSETFGLPEPPEGSVCFLLLIETTVTGGAA